MEIIPLEQPCPKEILGEPSYAILNSPVAILMKK